MVKKGEFMPSGTYKTIFARDQAIFALSRLGWNHFEKIGEFGLKWKLEPGHPGEVVILEEEK